MIGNHKHILLIGINDIDALVSQELFFLPILELKFNLSIRINIDSQNNLLFFNDWAQQIHSPHWDK